MVSVLRPTKSDLLLLRTHREDGVWIQGREFDGESVYGVGVGLEEDGRRGEKAGNASVEGLRCEEGNCRNGGSFDDGDGGDAREVVCVLGKGL